MESNQGQCRMQPSVWFLMGTLLFTSVATAMLCGAIMTDHWEHVTWDRGKLESIALNHKNVTPGSRHKNHHQWMLEWLLDGQVGRIVYTNEEGLRKTQVRPKGVKGFKVDRTSSVSSVTAVEEEEEEEHDEIAVFLIPMHGGIWTLCVSLTEVDCKTDADCKPHETCYHYRGNYNIAKCEPNKACDAHDKCGDKQECVSGKCTANEQRHLLLRVGFTQTQCINYLDPEMNKGEEGRADWQHRMQNLSISCALVCLIILGSSALVGAFGVLKHQISAVLVTGVMYLLAATFAMFTLTIIHFKRHQSKQKPEKTAADCLLTGGGGSMLIDGVSPSRAAVQGHIQVDADIFTARVFTTSWSLDLGWGGVTLCVLASVLWILLSKIMRYSPLSTLVT